MEEVNSVLNPNDEVKKLQDMVRKLELQNEMLRTQQNTRNGVIETRLICGTGTSEIGEKKISAENERTEDEILDLSKENWSDEESCLYAPSHTDAGSEKKFDLYEWLTKDEDSEIQRVRESLVSKLEEIERGSRRQIDTRTFTRPKKRLGLRPALYDFESEENGRNTTRILESRELSEITPGDGESSVISQSPKKGFDGTFSVADRNSPKNNAQPVSTVLNTTFGKPSSAIATISPACTRSPKLDASGVLNSTFSVNDACDVKDERKARLVYDSGEEDRLSSASDSSFSNRLLNVGDVQTLARMQEESLKLMSTPKSEKTNGGFSNHEQPEEPMPSPIPRYQDDNHGYHSDNQDCSSDHSSVDGMPPRTRSSQSSVIGDSLHSSPAGSPFGSQTITIPSAANGGTKLGSTFSKPSHVKTNEAQPVAKQQIRQPTRPVQSNIEVNRPADHPQKGRAWSGLRPPSTNMNQNRQSSVRPASSIPRPQSRIPVQSRIPAPRSRTATYGSSSNQTVTKADWMDGCY